MNKKLKVAVLCGGRSPEHQISLISAQNIIASLDKERFIPVIIGITKDGDWYYYKDGLNLENKDHAQKIKLIPSEEQVLLSQNATHPAIYSLRSGQEMTTLDVIFPALHGTYGEDGSIQGLAKICNLPCVGCGILSSAMGMDKDIMKKILKQAKIDVAASVTVRGLTKEQFSYETVTKELGPALFIKPANLGSSVGVKFVDNATDYDLALNAALGFDDKVLVEEKITGREIECAVLGNENPKSSEPGEIMPQTEFYTFENKYLNADGAKLAIPADLSEAQARQIKQMAIDTYVAMECSGLTRVDLFVCPDGRTLINEINTIPGFTNISMYPKLWELAGIDQEELISQLIDLSISRFKKEASYKHMA